MARSRRIRRATFSRIDGTFTGTSPATRCPPPPPAPKHAQRHSSSATPLTSPITAPPVAKSPRGKAKSVPQKMPPDAGRAKNRQPQTSTQNVESRSRAGLPPGHSTMPPPPPPPKAVTGPVTERSRSKGAKAGEQRAPYSDRRPETPRKVILLPARRVTTPRGDRARNTEAAAPPTEEHPVPMEEHLHLQLRNSQFQWRSHRQRQLRSMRISRDPTGHLADRVLQSRCQTWKKEYHCLPMGKQDLSQSQRQRPHQMRPTRIPESSELLLGRHLVVRS